LDQLLASGRAVDLILALMAVEAIALLALWRRRRRGVPPAQLIANLAAGGSLLLALRAALTGAHWVWLGLWFTTALIAHLADLGLRWRTEDRNGPQRNANERE
jgi:hypothetical protein